MIVVSEGFRLEDMPAAHSHKGLDAFNRPRLGGVADIIAPAVEELTGIESRATVLGHMQRGGIPTAYDRVLATRLGMAAVAAVCNEDWGSIVALKGTEIVISSIADAVHELNAVQVERYDEAAVLFG
ncbi:hypothetical protein BH09ACT12_BH09ACT12_16980 [soil metagenome]